MISVISSVPTLADLPAPPAGKTGWPWTEATPLLPDHPPRGGEWPSISLITPSYNQGCYIEETIRSVLLQGYPNLEYFIIDGGSTDETVEIIRKYEPWLAGWVSEKDKGQSDAINKGFARCSGEIFNWMCSDDLLTTGALRLVAEAFHEGDCDVLAGACFCQYDEEPQRSEVRSAKRKGWERIPYHAAIWQPSCYFRRSIVGRGDLVLRDMHYCMDRELWCHLFQQGARWKWTEDVLSHYRFTGANKSVVGGSKIIDEISRIFEGHVPDADRLPHLLRRYWLPAVLKSEKASGPMKPVLRGVSKSVAAWLLARFPKEHVRALQREFYSYSVWG
ncbi:MAG: glycosyltransferase [Verrucomicrobiae bacterium]|nr:glycosyltransferase [Verrucomicrobiae bacterium]